MSVSGIHGHVLEVTVVGCNRLKDTEWLSRQDPYVCLEYGSTKYRTRTCTDGGKAPVFQERFTFTLIEGLREINVVVWNSNSLTYDDFIGSGKIQLQKALSQGFDDTAWSLQTKTGRYAGEVRLIMHYGNAKPPTTTYAPTAPQYTAPPPHVPQYSAPPANAKPPTTTYAPTAPQYTAPPPHVPQYSAPPATYPASYPPPATTYPSPSPYPAYPSSAYPPPPSAYPPPHSAYPPPPSAYPPPPSSYPPSTYPQQSPYYPPGPFPGHYPPPPY